LGAPKAGPVSPKSDNAAAAAERARIRFTVGTSTSGVRMRPSPTDLRTGAPEGLRTRSGSHGETTEPEGADTRSGRSASGRAPARRAASTAVRRSAVVVVVLDLSQRESRVGDGLKQVQIVAVRIGHHQCSPRVRDSGSTFRPLDSQKLGRSGPTKFLRVCEHE